MAAPGSPLVDRGSRWHACRTYSASPVLQEMRNATVKAYPLVNGTMTRTERSVCKTVGSASMPGT
jgi:hypothetical protein